MELSNIPIPNPSVVLKEGIDGWAVLVNLDSGGSVALNPTGLVIWEAVDGQRTQEEIIDQVRQQFSGAPDTLADDVKDILKTFFEDGFLGRELEDGVKEV